MHNARPAADLPQPRTPYVPPARLDLSDQLLTNTRDLWSRVVDGQQPITPAEMDFLGAVIGPLLDELVQRRAAMTLIETALKPGTVVAFERAR